jgi:hypothetical protein
LGWDAALLQRKLPQVIERLQRFLEDNFRSEFFTAPHAIEAEAQRRLQQVLHPTIVLPGSVLRTEPLEIEAPEQQPPASPFSE